LSPTSTPQKPTIEEKIATEQEASALAHTWVVAAEVAIDNATAKRASFRGSFRTEGGMRVDALEVYCRGCRRPLDEVGVDSQCAAKIDNTHLIGGDPGVRAKRNVVKPTGPIKHQIIDRRGMNGYSVHAGR
jgi:hypothetical protein